MSTSFTKIHRDLYFAAKNNKNVLIIGEAGVGKTEIIKKIFQEMFPGKWKYYSTPTMDPWVDLVGCPREKVDPTTGISHLELIMPKEWANDDVEAVFLDEINRAEPKVLNALMELLLFKSINGRVFKNLKVIWAAANPVNKDYHTEELDFAQKDRFTYHIHFPNELNTSYFHEKYGEKIAKAAYNWWTPLDKDKKSQVTPRRLDDALDIHLIGGDINNVLHASTNPGKLIKEITSGSAIEKLMEIINKNVNGEKIRDFLAEGDNYFNCKDYIINKNNDILQYISEERLSELISNNTKVKDYCLENIITCKNYEDVIQDIVNANTNTELVNSIKTNIRWIDYISEKEINNKELIENERKLKELIKSKKLDHVLSNVFDLPDTEWTKDQKTNNSLAKQEQEIYEYIKNNKKDFTASDYAITVLIKGIPNSEARFPDVDELAHYLANN